MVLDKVYVCGTEMRWFISVLRDMLADGCGNTRLIAQRVLLVEPLLMWLINGYCVGGP